MPNDSQAEILHSWKEISAYVRKGIRTLQRYETAIGFPVQRPLGKRRSSVIAFRRDIDEWLQRSPQVISRNGHNKAISPEWAMTIERARINRAHLVRMRQLMRQEREKVHHVRRQLREILSNLMQRATASREN